VALDCATLASSKGPPRAAGTRDSAAWAWQASVGLVA